MLISISIPQSASTLNAKQLHGRLQESSEIALLNDAVALLGRLGYTDVHGLEGGINAWTTAGYELFTGVNVPSKAFGEVVEIQVETPHISAPQLYERLNSGEKIVVVDGRTPDEFFRFSIPGAYNVPNAELPYRIRELAPDPATPIVLKWSTS